MLTLWAMARSPLILGANLTMLDADTLGLLTNRDALRIDQTATGKRVRSSARETWSRGLADLPDSEYALAVFNRGTSRST